MKIFDKLIKKVLRQAQGKKGKLSDNKVDNKVKFDKKKEVVNDDFLKNLPP